VVADVFVEAGLYENTKRKFVEADLQVRLA